jgi:PPK2 family polyphosphate:nucleotide phosphotransferase
MKLRSKGFIAQPDKAIELKDWPTSVKPFYKSKKDYKKLLGLHVDEMQALQKLLYASDRYALLLIFQAMDAAGKDGAIMHVMSGVNPQGCQVFSFKHPNATELEHDFLWRTTRSLPERGKIGIFNRSYYEEVLIVRVHPEVLRAERLPSTTGPRQAIWQRRYRAIVDLERHLHDSGTRIVKFYLHLSKEEQRKRFLQRIDVRDKNWKFTLSDFHERRFWAQYMTAYEECISATSTTDSPWYIVPADDKPNARLIVSQIVLETMRAMDMAYPTPDARQRRDMRAIRARLAC